VLNQVVLTQTNKTHKRKYRFLSMTCDTLILVAGRDPKFSKSSELQL